MRSIGDMVQRLRADILSDRDIHVEERNQLARKLDRLTLFGSLYCVPAGLLGAVVGALGFMIHPAIGLITIGIGASLTTYSAWQLTRLLQLRILEDAHKNWREIPALAGVGGTSSVAVPSTDVDRR